VDQLEDEMGGHVARVEEMRFYTKFCSENLEGRDHKEDIGVDGRIPIRMDLREIGWGGVDWMHLAPDRDQ
jgi:hypothetical protein